MILAGLCCLIAIPAAGAARLFVGRLQPDAGTEQLFDGVSYERQVRRSPRLIVIHLLKVNLRSAGLSFLVTPCELEDEQSCPARTTSKFLQDFDLDLAINGDGFNPWYSNHLLDYYPHSGDPVEPIGLAASQGVLYADYTDAEPTLYLSRVNQLRFNTPPGRIYNAISGNLMLVEQGRALSLPDDAPQPRSALGIDQQGKFLLLVVVDGRQPGYSQGVTLAELAEILVENDVQNGLNLDGGGSSTLVVRNPLGLPRVLNSPINHGIPGWQRPVANHLGIKLNSR